MGLLDGSFAFSHFEPPDPKAADLEVLDSQPLHGAAPDRQLSDRELADGQRPDGPRTDRNRSERGRANRGSTERRDLGVPSRLTPCADTTAAAAAMFSPSRGSHWTPPEASARPVAVAAWSGSAASITPASVPAEGAWVQFWCSRSRKLS